MKTTINLPDALYDEVRRVARANGVTITSVIETALRHAVQQAPARPGAFRLAKHAGGGEGLNPELDGVGWNEILRLAYEGRGG